jgi:exosome complex component RRP45
VGALQHFRLPEVTVEGERLVVHHSFDKEPSPLPMHHIPMSVTFAIFHEGTLVAVDPTEREEAVMGGRITYSLNIHKYARW